MKRIFACVLLFGVALAASWITYRSSTKGFGIIYPAGWAVLEARGMVRFAALKDGVALAEFAVRVEPARPLEAWVRARQKSETLMDGSSRVETVRSTRLAGRAAKRIMLFEFDRYTLEEAVVVGKRLYVISYDDQNPNDPNFKAHAAIYARMRASLSF